jgi:hypothetical protein
MTEQKFQRREISKIYFDDPMANEFTWQEYTGYWRLPCGTVQFTTMSKPRWLTRFLMKQLMQWEWIEA